MFEFVLFIWAWAELGGHGRFISELAVRARVSRATFGHILVTRLKFVAEAGRLGAHCIRRVLVTSRQLILRDALGPEI